LARTLSDSHESDGYFDPSTPCLHVKERMDAFAHWYDEYFSGLRTFANSASVFDNINFEKCGQKFQVTLINSATFCFDNEDSGKLWLGRRSLDLITERSDDSAIRLAVMHHPLDWLSHEEVQAVKAGLRSRFDCIVTGHLHQTDVESVCGVVGSSIHLAAGATYQTTDWPNTAMVVRVHANSLSIFPIRFSESPMPRWTVDPSVYPLSHDYTGEVSLPGRGTGGAAPPPVVIVETPAVLNVSAEDARKSLEAELFAAEERPIFIEPRVMSRPQERAFKDADSATRISLAEMVTSGSSYFIETRAEYGGSTLCKRLEYEFLVAGEKNVFRKDARSIPNYRKKLEGEFPSEAKGIKTSVLVLDHFDFDRDDKLLKELLAASWFKKIVIVTVDRGLHPTRAIDPEITDRGFSYLYLWGIGREDIRNAALAIFPGVGGAGISGIVSKVYDDLLALCIPLTPSNVLMYLKVLHREGAFQPLNRVDIVSRYIQDSIRKPSDVYKDTFNVKNRMDVLSAFVFQLYVDQRHTFDDTYWYTFITAHKLETLTEFDERSFLSELEESRIIGRQGRALFFRYSFFFTFFLGRQLSVRQKLLDNFVDNEEYLRIGGVIDVVTGLSSDNSVIMEKLVRSLREKMEEFANTYVKLNFDPLENAYWPDSSKEDEELWKPIAEEIERGPHDSHQIDLLKTSVFAESRTVDQQVRFSKFNDLENAIFATAGVVTDALRNSDDVGGHLKLMAYDSILKTHLTAFQVGTLFSDFLAERRYFTWGGVAFIDFDRAVKDTERGSAEAKMTIIDALCASVADRTAGDLGTSKLTAVFKARDAAQPAMNFLEFLNFNCVLVSKGPGWDKVIVGMIERAGKNSFYLWAMLCNLMTNYKTDIALGRDRDLMKRLIAHIEAKRSHRKDVVGAKAVTSMLAQLEADKHFTEGNFGFRSGEKD